MCKIFLFLLTVCPILFLGKETRVVVCEMNYPLFKEVGYILKSDSGKRHLSYRTQVGKRLPDEFYKIGEPDCLWTQFNEEGIIRARGGYKNNKRDSIWEYFNDKGQLEQKLDFTHSEVIYYQTPFAKQPFRIITKTDTIMSVLDRPPLFIGGMSRFDDFVNKEIRIPHHKTGEKVNGTVYVTVMIDSMGKCSNPRILKGIGDACNHEALRVMKTIPDEWLPGALNDRFVTVDYIIPFQFNYKVREVDVYDDSNSLPGGWEFIY